MQLKGNSASQFKYIRNNLPGMVYLMLC